MTSRDETSSYDRVPYGSRVFPLSSPDRLATVGSLHGVSTARPESCRMLELGCGDGTNLLSMAYALPASSFLGIDLSDVHVEMARKSAAKLRLTNVEFVAADVMELVPVTIGRFDFISAHGLFSWVPSPVRDAILKLYAECLSENGIGYISYNTYPGARLREMAWDMMQFHASDAADSETAVARAREIARFISHAAVDGIHKNVLQAEAERLEQRDDANVFHDDLAEINQPLYFHEFSALLDMHRLRYVAEADPDIRTVRESHPQTLSIIEDFAQGDRIKSEQYLDFLSGRRFRTSLVCRAETETFDRPLTSRARSLRFSSQLTRTRNHDREVAVRFSTPEGDSVEIQHPAIKEALDRMSVTFPRALHWDDLVDGTPTVNEGDLELLSRTLLELSDVGLVAANSYQPPIAARLSKCPRASAFARLQIASNCRGVTSLAGLNVEILQPMVRHLLSLLDGSREKSDLVNELMKAVPAQEKTRDGVKQEILSMVDGNLKIFLRLGLLEPNRSADGQVTDR